MALLVVTPCSMAFETWIGGQKDYQIYTGLDAGDETSGYWYAFSDEEEQGASSILWNAPLVMGEHVLDSVDNKCSGICGTATLNGFGGMEQKPYAGIAFDVAGKAKQSDSVSSAGDASSWKGLCIAYNSDFDMALELGLEASAENLHGEKNPRVRLPKGDWVVRNIAWSDFVSAGEKSLSGEKAAAQLVSVRVKFQGEVGCYHFNVFAVGPYGDCNVPASVKNASLAAMENLPECTTTAIASVAKAGELHVSLAGRLLSLSGSMNGDELRLVNVRGDVVRRESVSRFANVYDLSPLPAGIYMLQVKGFASNHFRKILLK